MVAVPANGGAEPPGGFAVAIPLAGYPQSRKLLQIRAAISLVGPSTLLGRIVLTKPFLRRVYLQNQSS